MPIKYILGDEKKECLAHQTNSKRQLSFRSSCNDDCLNDKDEDIVGICQAHAYIFWFFSKYTVESFKTF